MKSSILFDGGVGLAVDRSRSFQKMLVYLVRTLLGLRRDQPRFRGAGALDHHAGRPWGVMSVASGGFPNCSKSIGNWPGRLAGGRSWSVKEVFVWLLRTLLGLGLVGPRLRGHERLAGMPGLRESTGLRAQPGQRAPAGGNGEDFWANFVDSLKAVWDLQRPVPSLLSNILCVQFGRPCGCGAVVL